MTAQDKERIRRSIQGALKNCIDAHGPITNAYAMSASKRILGQLWTTLYGEGPPMVNNRRDRKRAKRTAPLLEIIEGRLRDWM